MAPQPAPSQETSTQITRQNNHEAIKERIKREICASRNLEKDLDEILSSIDELPIPANHLLKTLDLEPDASSSDVGAALIRLVEELARILSLDLTEDSTFDAILEIQDREEALKDVCEEIPRALHVILAQQPDVRLRRRLEIFTRGLEALDLEDTKPYEIRSL